MSFGEYLKSGKSGMPESEGNFLVSPDWGDTGADNTFGRIARAQWSDYKSRFMPAENELIDSIGNPHLLKKQIDRNVDFVNMGFDNAQTGVDQKMRQYGSQLTDRQEVASTRQSDLSRNLGVIDAKNVTRLAKKERDMQAMAGGVSTSSKATRAGE